MNRNYGLSHYRAADFDPLTDWYEGVLTTEKMTRRMRRRRFLQRLVFVLACGVGAGFILACTLYGALAVTGQGL